ncbi:MAG: DUF4350 domain-containing protein [Cryomorphaceae bacterium]|nr:DUF4350 domain-containing protein [Cryomorphaceae bacterium]
MNKGMNGGWIIGGGALLLLLLFYFFYMGERDIDWYESYEEVREMPYGTAVFRSLMEKSNGERFTAIDSNLVSTLASNDTPPSSYIIIGDELFYDSLETQALLDYVRKGNSALLISNDFSSVLLQEVFETTYGFDDQMDYVAKSIFEFYADTAVGLNIRAGKEVFDRPIPCVSIRENKPVNRLWKSFTSGLEFKNNSGNMVSHGYFNMEYSNFIEIPIGDGRLFLHSTPLAFTNIQLLKEENFNYVNQVVSYLNEGTLYWDSYNRDYQAISDPNFDGDDMNKFDDGPLAFILSTRSLRRAWYTLIGLAFLFLLFGAKRTQRPVDVLRPVSNTSIEFAQTIGTMFRMENSHQKLVELKFKHFKVFIFERYGIRVPEETEMNSEFIKILSMKSDVKTNQIEELFGAHRKAAYNPELDAKGLVEFHHTMDLFYKNCR